MPGHIRKRRFCCAADSSDFSCTAAHGSNKTPRFLLGCWQKIAMQAIRQDQLARLALCLNPPPHNSLVLIGKGGKLRQLDPVFCAGMEQIRNM